MEATPGSSTRVVIGFSGSEKSVWVSRNHYQTFMKVGGAGPCVALGMSQSQLLAQGLGVAEVEAQERVNMYEIAEEGEEW